LSKADKVKIVFLADDYAGYESRGLLGQHGLSVLIEVEKDGRRTSVLFDTGQYADAIIHNAEILGINLKEISVIALSHNHYDHTGGLYGILKYVGRRIPVVGHPDIFLPSISIEKDRVRMNIGIPQSRRELEEAGAEFLLVKSPMEVAPGVYFLGEVEREWPELSPLLESNYTIKDGELVRHELKDDTGMAVVVEGLGTVVIGGCSHSGIANIVRQAEKVTGERPFAVMGGFHLISSPDSVINEVIKKLRELGVEEVHAGHCTGLRAEHALLREYGERFRLLHAGHTVIYESRG